MGRICAGIFGPLAMVGAIVHGLLHGADVNDILLRSWICLIGFSCVGLLAGMIGQQAIKESIDWRLKQEFERKRSHRELSQAS